MTHQQIKKYCEERLAELRQILNMPNPWGFLCAAGFIDFLSKLKRGQESNGDDYKDLIRDHFPAKYLQFHYSAHTEDLASQFWHIMRCGLLHSFSVFPDNRTGSHGWARSVILSHDGMYNGLHFPHLSNFTENGNDSAILLASTFADDLAFAIDSLFQNPTVQGNSELWVNGSSNIQPPRQPHPPIGSLPL